MFIEIISVFIVAIIIFFILVMVKNWGHLLTGFSTMTKEERSKYDIVKCTRIMGSLGILICISVLYSLWIDLWIGVTLSMIVFVITIIFGIITVIDDGKYILKKD